MLRIAHLTSVHVPSDNRIRHKECASIKAAGWDVVLVACSDRDQSDATGVRIRTIRPVRGRVARMTLVAWRVYRAAIAENADVYHIHDPELLPWAVLLRLRGKRVVYDVHEDVAATIAYKPYLPALARPLISRMVRFGEWASARWLNAIITATPHLAQLATRFGRPVVVVQNFPRLDEVDLAPSVTPYCERPANVVYVGGISRVRGIGEMVDAMLGASMPSDAKLHLAGRWMPPALRPEMTLHPGWGRVVDHGLLDRPTLMSLLSECRVGLVTIWPEHNYVNAYATKMFEYMAKGLPVVASDFPLWRRIVEGAGCGLLVDPKDPDAIAGAIGWMMANPAEAEAMGRRGEAAVRTLYNWDREAGKLISLYKVLAGLGES